MKIVFALSLFFFVLTASALSCIDVSYRGVCVVAEDSPGRVAVPAAGVVGSVIGDDRDGGARSHQGIDIFNRAGTPVRAINFGTVSKSVSVDAGTCGKQVSLLHRDGTKSLYCHLDTVSVRVGQSVSKGQFIGTIGNTGNARTTPPHLHFEVRKGVTVIDPCSILQCRRGSRLG